MSGRGARASSPWSADPLSWLATDWLALACAAYAGVQSIGLSTLTLSRSAVAVVDA